MKRRNFITLLGGAATAWPLAARAQQPAMPVIGWLSSRNAETDAFVLPAFRRALEAHGYIEGRHFKIEYRFADGRDDRLPELAAELVRSRVSLAVTVGEGAQGARSLRAASTTMPIVFVDGGDPVNLGLVASLNRPGGNTTGVMGLLGLLGSKRLGLLHDLLPRATNIVALDFPDGLSPEMPEVAEAARRLGKQLLILRASTDAEIDAAFASLPQMQAEALYVGRSSFLFSRAARIVAHAARIAIPAIYFRREFADAGGLMSYGTDTREIYRVLGDYAGRILKGEKPGDLPVQQSTKFEFLINLKTAKTLGLTIPPGVLAIVDEVIE
jgi:putative ABC transport system substrate-binding protein